MKLLIGLCALCVVVLAQNAVDVNNAIKRAAEMNAGNRARNRNTPTGEACERRCPMANFHGRRPDARVTFDNTANDILTAMRLLKEDGFNSETMENNQEVVAAFQIATRATCEPDIECDTDGQYRTADGTCNNLPSPRQGSAGAAQIRLMDPAYDDGVSSPRTKSAVTQNDLPSARKVSNAVHIAAPGPVARSTKINLHVFQMGQFLDHDIISTPVQGEIEDCCAAIEEVNNCFPIRIENDPNPNFGNSYCMNFARSAPHVCPVTSTSLPRREQINAITSFIDASNVYGSSKEEQLLLRKKGTGFMKTTDPVNYGTRLPDSNDADACVSDVERGIFCSLAGDHRVNIVPSLTAYHNLFVLEHNRIATQLSTIYSNSEELFQKTRRIVIAIMQKIVYDEFLPSFLSPQTMESFELSSNAQYSYSATIDPTVSNAFGIAYRMGHTWIPRTMDLFDSGFIRFRGNRTEEIFFDPDLTYFNGQTPGMDGLALWLTGENAPATDRIIEDAVRDNLFLDDEGNSFDLVSLNIQRGRDHGLPSYTAFRKFCKLDAEEVQNFQALQDIDQDGINRLSNVYSDPRDIDLFTGALTETLEDDQALGPTLSCILGDQFRRLKFGDRFWYQGKDANFNRDQIQAIRNYSMAKLLCNNYVFRTVNAPNAFLATDEFSACDAIAQLDLAPFGVKAPSPPTPPTRPTPAPRPNRPPTHHGAHNGPPKGAHKPPRKGAHKGARHRPAGRGSRKG